MTERRQDILPLALQAHRKGDYSEAERLYSALLEQEPGNFDALHLLGVIRAQQRAFAEAGRLIAKALESGSSVSALNNYGGVLVELGRTEEAIARLSQALAMKPDYAEAHFNLGNALRKSKQLGEAANSFATAIKLKPGYIDAQLNLSETLRELNRQGEAIETLRQAVSFSPNNASLHNNLATLLRETGDLEGARRSFEQVAAQLRRQSLARPNDAAGRANLGNALMKCDRAEEAAAAFADAAKIKPDFVEAWEGLAGALRALGRQPEAIAALYRAIEIRPADAGLRNLLGIALQEAGRLEDAAAALRQALTLDPSKPETLFHLLRLVKAAPGDEIIAQLEAIARDSAALSPDAHALLRFAMGKAYEDIGRYDEAFSSYSEGNRLARPSVGYNEEAWRRRFEHLHNAVTARLIAQRTGQGSQSELPIFVVGFPRSGTTLIEQILASHPMVHGAGELRHIAELTTDEILAGREGTRFPESLARLDPNDFRRLGDTYVERLRKLAPAATRIVDKLPENFMFLGFIHLILPRAKIIHVMRDPVDTCVSCFAQRFHRDSAGFTYDLGELGRFYRMYRDIMDHWRAALPPGSMMEVQYESIVEDIESQVRRILDYCGLPWDDRCLAFHETERTMRTASLAQVRQPLYRSGLQRWRRYERHLAPLFDALGHDDARPPA